ncbi:hypothetical protein Leryth_018097 [Lithospermum erythrorhizon]|nr:hypothetical protein Leryth_018097 [Lithospermum erythrorhizon]
MLNRRSFDKFVRRAQSDSDLEGLMSTSFDMEEVYRMKVQQSSDSHKNSSMVLHSEPSFAIYNNTHNQDSEDDNELAKSDSLFGLSETINDQLEALGTGEFTFGNMGFIEENDIEEEEETEDEKMDRLGGLVENLEIGGEGGGLDKTSLYLGAAGVAKDFDENGDLGEYYMRILTEEPSNPLFLRNYAQFLQCQGDLSRAEGYYYRATLADPNDGEILMQYANIVRELHHDQDKAASYFERAVSAASDDSHVQAAYVRFLWEMDESDEEDDESSANIRTPTNNGHNSVAEDQQMPASSPLHLAVGLGLDVQGLGYGLSSDYYTATSSYDKGSIEDHYKRMIEGNPRDPLYLRNYADFLYQSKGDLAGAEEYYSRATLVDPSDGEIVSQYAKLVWQLHHNKDKATTYFERAVQASPENSDVLGAYARFLWEVEEDDEEIPEGKFLSID